MCPRAGCWLRRQGHLEGLFAGAGIVGVARQGGVDADGADDLARPKGYEAAGHLGVIAAAGGSIHGTVLNIRPVCQRARQEGGKIGLVPFHDRVGIFEVRVGRYVDTDDPGRLCAIGAPKLDFNEAALLWIKIIVVDVKRTVIIMTIR